MSEDSPPLLELAAAHLSLTENLPLNYVRKGLDGRITDCNQRYCQMVGLRWHPEKEFGFMIPGVGKRLIGRVHYRIIR